MKKVVILRAAGNELANQLWNYASIYAYTLERGYALENPSFFEYGEYFKIPVPNLIFKILFFLPFKNYTKRKKVFRRKVWRKLYLWYTNIVIWLHRDRLISYASATNEPYYLPPTKESSEKLRKIEQSEGNIYMDGWLFRNSIGLEKHHIKVREYFRPRADIERRVMQKVQELRKNYQRVIGIHVRQGDYQVWRGGVYFIDQKRVREIIEEHFSKFEGPREKTCFVITSDGPIDEKYFSGLNVVINNNNAVTDLFLLASTDTIIGSDSTFGAFASYYGNIPFIVMQKETMDWDYYRHQTTFFENKYSTVVHY